MDTRPQPKQIAKAGAPQSEARQRLYVVAVVCAFWLAAITARLLWVQVYKYPAWMARAAKQQERTFDVSPKRGIIYDRNGNPLAMSIEVESLFAVPQEVPDKVSTSQILGEVLKIDSKDLLARLQNPTYKNFTWVARKLDSDTAQRVRTLNLKGVSFAQESKRFYPKHELAAQVLGGVGMDDKGTAGVELAEDEALHGIEGRAMVSVDAKHRSVSRVEKEPESGENLVLTIDEKLQYIAERELKQGIDDTHAESGTVVVQDPRTGEILALANWPTFDPNGIAHDPRELKDHAVSDVYEPGSTFKMVTVAGALEEGLTNPDERIDCQNGVITFNGYTIHDWKKFGVLSVSGILENSSDVGAIKLALRLGNERFYKYIRGFGFGTKTGIELPGESRGMTKPVNRWSAASIGSISMGQELAVTPVQLASMTSAMANDGILTPTRIIAGVAPPNGSFRDIEFKVPDQHRVISSVTAGKMRAMLQRVVLQGTAKKAQLNGWTAAGKTGTAQKIDPKTHRYGSKDIASFSGFAPVNRPAITVLVVLDSPSGGHHHGGDTAAPIFQRIAQQALQTLGIPRDAQIDPKKRVLTASTETLQETVSQRLGTLDFDDEAIATMNDDAKPVSGAVLKNARAVVATDFAPVPMAPPAEDLVAPPVGKVDVGAGVIVNGTGPVVPSFAGKTVRAALQQAQSSGMPLQIAGSGIAVQQSVAPGAHLPPGQSLVVWFHR
ncbi:MAG: penicillin-binding protein [Acidobacteriaceae bacterium]